MDATIEVQDVLEYLNEHYLRIEDVAYRAAVQIDWIEALIEAGCIPPHSHEMSGALVAASSAFGGIAVGSSVRYFAPSIVDWIEDVKSMPSDWTLDAIRERQWEKFRDEFRDALLTVEGAKQAYAECFDADGNLAEDGFSQKVEKVWDYIMDGTYGVCLQDVKTLSIVKKGTAVFQLEETLGWDANQLSTDQERQIHAAAALYDSVATQFGPHERSQSSRERIRNAVTRKFKLDD